MALKYYKKEEIRAPVFYILGKTAGGFIGHYANKIHKRGGKLFVNPDGLEWKRTKWAAQIRSYFKVTEKKIVRYADFSISENEGIKVYLISEYGQVAVELNDYVT